VVDLHAHSNVSDGMLAPDDLVRRARASGVSLFALTDHDELAGLPQALQTAAELGLRFVPGVEISVSWRQHTIHVLGLRIDLNDEALTGGLALVRQGRWRRAERMAEGLEKVGFANAFAGALGFAANPQMISRTHFARWMIQTGRCANLRDVFKQYLTPGKPGYVPHDWASLSDAVGWIVHAGGIAVIAHPGRYGLKDADLCELFSEFKDLGGRAIEVVTSSHSTKQVRRFAQFAQSYGFEASRGSDFHGPDESSARLGEGAPLPEGLVPVWHHFM